MRFGVDGLAPNLTTPVGIVVDDANTLAGLSCGAGCRHPSGAGAGHPDIKSLSRVVDLVRLVIRRPGALRLPIGGLNFHARMSRQLATEPLLLPIDGQAAFEANAHAAQGTA